MRFTYPVIVSMLIGVPAAAAQSVSNPEPFAPGIVSVDGERLYRGAFSPDGRAFYFFRKHSDEGEDYRVFRTIFEESDWQPADLLGLGDPGASSLYPVVSPDGAYLVFSSYRPIPGSDRAENANLWAARIQDGQVGEPYLLDGLSTPANYDAGPWFAADGSLHFSSTLPDWSRTSHRIASSAVHLWSGWEEIDPWEIWSGRNPEVHVWGGAFSPDGSIAIIEASERDEDGRPGPSDLWLAMHDQCGWGPMVRLDSGINTADTENFSVFAPDGSVLLFVRDFSQYLRIDTETVLAQARSGC